MLDLNDLRVFERVSTLQSFAQASRALAMPRSSVSRAIARLERALGTRLLQRTTREVALTPAGTLFRGRCAELLQQVHLAVDELGNMSGTPKGKIKVSAGVGFGINVLGEQLPEFLARFPEIDVELDLRSESIDLVAERVDVAIRLGRLPDSGAVAVRLGSMPRYLCASPAYLEQHPAPDCIDRLGDHAWVAMLGRDGKPIPITLSRDGETLKVEPRTRVCLNEALTQFRLVLKGAGIGVLSGYLVGPELEKGNLTRLLPAWSAPSLAVSVIFPTKREMAPSIRAFVDFMLEQTERNGFWLHDPIVP